MASKCIELLSGKPVESRKVNSGHRNNCKHLIDNPNGLKEHTILELALILILISILLSDKQFEQSLVRLQANLQLIPWQELPLQAAQCQFNLCNSCHKYLNSINKIQLKG